jgi:hypothetical protein
MVMAVVGLLSLSKTVGRESDDPALMLDRFKASCIDVDLLRSRAGLERDPGAATADQRVAAPVIQATGACVDAQAGAQLDLSAAAECLRRACNPLAGDSIAPASSALSNLWALGIEAPMLAVRAGHGSQPILGTDATHSR